MIKENQALANIATNKRASYEYFIEKELYAGLSLQGWEVKALRVGNANISNSYVLLKDGEAFLFGAHFKPSTYQLTHFNHICNPIRTRKLLLTKRELNILLGCLNNAGYTAIALSLYWKSAWVKIKIGIAKGKKKYDKRAQIRKSEWQRDKARLRKHMNN